MSLALRSIVFFALITLTLSRAQFSKNEFAAIEQLFSSSCKNYRAEAGSTYRAALQSTVPSLPAGHNLKGSQFALQRKIAQAITGLFIPKQPEAIVVLIRSATLALRRCRTDRDANQGFQLPVNITGARAIAEAFAFERWETNDSTIKDLISSSFLERLRFLSSVGSVEHQANNVLWLVSLEVELSVFPSDAARPLRAISTILLESYGASFSPGNRWSVTDVPLCNSQVASSCTENMDRVTGIAMDAAVIAVKLSTGPQTKLTTVVALLESIAFRAAFLTFEQRTQDRAALLNFSVSLLWPEIRRLATNGSLPVPILQPLQRFSMTLLWNVREPLLSLLTAAQVLGPLQVLGTEVPLAERKALMSSSLALSCTLVSCLRAAPKLLRDCSALTRAAPQQWWDGGIEVLEIATRAVRNAKRVEASMSRIIHCRNAGQLSFPDGPSKSVRKTARICSKKVDVISCIAAIGQEVERITNALLCAYKEEMQLAVWYNTMVVGPLGSNCGSVPEHQDRYVERLLRLRKSAAKNNSSLLCGSPLVSLHKNILSEDIANALIALLPPPSAPPSQYGMKVPHSGDQVGQISLWSTHCHQMPVRYIFLEG